MQRRNATPGEPPELGHVALAEPVAVDERHDFAMSPAKEPQIRLERFAGVNLRRRRVAAGDAKAGFVLGWEPNRQRGAASWSRGAFRLQGVVQGDQLTRDSPARVGGELHPAIGAKRLCRRAEPQQGGAHELVTVARPRPRKRLGERLRQRHIGRGKVLLFPGHPRERRRPRVHARRFRGQHRPLTPWPLSGGNVAPSTLSRGCLITP